MSGDANADPSAARRILVVEDEMLVALMLEDILAGLGHTIIGPVASLDRALETAQREPLDAAILDVNLKGDEVYSVAELLASRNVPFAFVTGYGKRGLRTPWCERPVVQKPFTPDDVHAVMAGLLAPRAA
jgi:CheY-like chemotaxis protein